MMLWSTSSKMKSTIWKTCSNWRREARSKSWRASYIILNRRTRGSRWMRCPTNRSRACSRRIRKWGYSCRFSKLRVRWVRWVILEAISLLLRLGTLLAQEHNLTHLKMEDGKVWTIVCMKIQIQRLRLSSTTTKTKCLTLIMSQILMVAQEVANLLLLPLDKILAFKLSRTSLKWEKVRNQLS